MTRQTTSAHSWPAIIALMLAALSLNVAAAPCDPDESKWVPSRYYPAGAVVHHDGEWYQSRELHEGLEPGITFDWKQLDSAPECSGEAAPPAPIDKSDAKTGQSAQAGTVTESPDSPAPESSRDNELCEQPDQWLFSESYTVGSEASHGGKIWKAIRPTSGDMPGMNTPPRWQLVEDHCALESQLP